MNLNGFYVSLRKTTVVDVSEESHSLPPDGGPFREFKVADYHCPDEWSQDGIFVEAEEDEPLWFDFRGIGECACIPSVQRLNPITGEPANLSDGLSKDPNQNYLWLPNQLWMDGYVKDGKVYQFRVTKAGDGLAVSEFVLPEHMQDSHAIGFAFFAPKVSRAPVIEISNHGLTGPMFSPLHTPQNWKLADTKRSKGRSSSSSSSKATTGNLVLGKINSTRFTQNRVADNYNDTGGGALSSGEEVLRAHALKEQLTKGGEVADINEISTQLQNLVNDSDQTIVTNHNVDVNESAQILYAGSVIRGLDDADAEDVLINSINVVTSDADQEIAEDVLEDQQTFDKASMAMGGRIRQQILTDNNTVDYYHEKHDGLAVVYMVFKSQFRSIMSRGKRQNEKKKDKFVHSGEIGGVQVPLKK